MSKSRESSRVIVLSADPAEAEALELLLEAEGFVTEVIRAEADAADLIARLDAGHAGRLAALGLVAVGAANEAADQLAAALRDLTELGRKWARLRPELPRELAAEVEHWEAVLSEVIGRCRAAGEAVDHIGDAAVPSPPAPIALSDLLEAALRVLERGPGAGVVIERDYDPAAPLLAVRAAPLARALARVLEEAGRALADRPERRVRVRTRVEPEAVRIEIEDTGAGIDAGVLAHIFDPFLTSLALCRELVKAHGGELEVRSEVDRGTAVTIRLPRGDSPPAE